MGTGVHRAEPNGIVVRAADRGLEGRTIHLFSANY